MSETITQEATLREHVAEEVRALLGRRRMSSVALARSIGKSHTYVWRRLNGETAFDLDDLQGIAKTLAVDVRSLLPGETKSSHTLAPRPMARVGRPRDNRPAGRASGSSTPIGQRRTARMA